MFEKKTYTVEQPKWIWSDPLPTTEGTAFNGNSAPLIVAGVFVVLALICAIAAFAG
ncbi:hypothetical protein HJA82_29400 [Rhizobium bangladeshense]|uniref:hypothetical protein n=1 Tax=Rhizobium bangladeshense TaxID=1138189 RepID=UPI001C835926|nr:hypothetical protein [Rhizobium bangladeshense]MBX4911432.1 hypothetical protein [Rhizobium bangladeshense]